MTEAAVDAANTAAGSTGIDNGSAFDGVLDTNTSWEHMAYGVFVGKNYTYYREALVQQMAILIANEKYGASADLDANSSQMQAATSEARKLVYQSENSLEGVEDVNGGAMTNPHMYTTPSVSDASVGGNDAINPYSAFNLDDDIVHDVSFSNGQTWGQGRCYGEMYESKQVILYLTMGIPKYRNLMTWLQNATNAELSELNDKGSVSLLTTIGRLFKKGVSLAIQLPWLPIIWGANIISSIKDYKVTEYFYFRDNMPAYYRYWNALLSEIAVGMGIYGNDPQIGGQEDTANGNKGQPNGGANISSTDLSKYAQNLPTIMQDGPDIFMIMSRRARRMGGNVTRAHLDRFGMSSDGPVGGDALYADMEGSFKTASDNDEKEGVWDKIGSGLQNFWTGIKTGALEGMNFIGFRIERSDNANESFSNSTSESPLLQTLNNEVAQKRANSVDNQLTNGEGVTSAGLRIVKNAQQFMKNASSILSGQKGIEGTIAYVASGNGFFDLPKQWSGSSGMSRSLSFNMKLRARTGGDPVSIYQSIMIPLTALMAAALPRGVGDSTYTSPFLVRAFCKGMFSIPAGIINTLSITRGAGEFGWSLSRLPTVVDVSFTIEDLSPMMFLSMAGGSGMLDAIGQAFANNTKMHEYINTLVGIGLKERYYLLGQMKRRLKTALLIGKNTTFSATYRGYVMGDSSIIRSMMALTPYSWVKGN